MLISLIFTCVYIHSLLVIQIKVNTNKTNCGKFLLKEIIILLDLKFGRSMQITATGAMLGPYDTGYHGYWQLLPTCSLCSQLRQKWPNLEKNRCYTNVNE